MLDDIPKAFRLPANSDQRTDVPLIPPTAIREAIVNAVMHRSYRQRSPIQIIRYSNRLEIRNPGHSLVPDERLGEPGSITRNEKVAAVLHETRYAETKGSGVRAMREAMSVAGLSPPTFESDREKDGFVVTFLFHHFLNPSDVEWLGHFSALDLSEDEQRALVFVREVGAINNAAYRDINRVETLNASGHLRRLRSLGLLEQRGKSSWTYYVPTPRLLDPQAQQAAAQSQGPAAQQRRDAAQPHKPGAQPQKAAVQSHRLADLPQELQDAIVALGGRPDPAVVRPVIRRLCAWQPLTALNIADLLGRERTYVTRTYLTPMVQTSELERVYPEQESHPNQAYRTITQARHNVKRRKPKKK